MNPERWGQIKRIYDSAVDLKSGPRDEFLRKACAGDDALLKEVASLLAQNGNSGGLFDSPALEVVAKAVAGEKANRSMQNLVGQSFSHYRIERKLGEGGMGAVFLADDTSLSRKVALKFLPPELQQDSLARKRFLREARSAAALDNPYICSIHEVGEFEGRDFIVMEYIDGQMLSDKLRRGRLPLNQALQIAMEVAEALQAAHGKGIIHRDLKPSNIMIMKTGHAKVMDFGLAKQVVPSAGIESKEESVSTMTRSGMTLGTLAYMSPEQLRGEEVDTRSDIFSFGLVIYEMLTGRHPFRKESPMETGSAILHEEPKPVGAITPGIPPDLEKLISRCLRKDPERRVQHTGDVKLALAELKEEYDSGQLQVTPAVARPGLPLSTIVVAVAVVALIAAGWYWLSHQRPPEPEAPLVAEPLTSYPGYEDVPSFSPDGNFVAFQWCGEAPGANCDIYIKQIGVEPPSRLTTDPAVDFSPAWSPDGLFIAFLRQLSPHKSAVMIVPRVGGQERRVGESNAVQLEIDHAISSLAWTPDSKWLVIPPTDSGVSGCGLSLLSVETQEQKRLTTSRAGFFERAPAFSPDGRAMAFVRWRGDRSDLYLLRLGMDYEPQGEQKVSFSMEEPYVWAADWMPDGREIVFSRGGSLWRIAASDSAKPRKLAIASERTKVLAISRKGNRLAYTVPDFKSSIWRSDLQGQSQIPTSPFQLIRSTRNQNFPTYSPDGKRVAFDSDISGHDEIWACNSDGSNAAQMTSFGVHPKWSPDGRSIAFVARFGGSWDIYVVGANGGSPRRLGIDSSGGQPWPSWSRDSNWIFFRSNRSGSSEIWKVAITGGDAIQITPNGQSRDQPQESPDGKFLYYMSGEYPEQCSVWRMPIGGGEGSKVVDSIACLDCDYAVGERGIYFFTLPDKQGRSDIDVYDLPTGERRKILTIAQHPLSITVSPDGRTILYTQDDQAGSVLMLVDKFR